MIKYNVINVGNNNIKLSPSGLNKFIFNPKEWMNDMKGLSTFKGNESTIYGTCIHYIFETMYEGISEDNYWKDVKEYINKEVNKDIIDEIEQRDILNRLKKNYKTIVSWYINEDESTVLHSEKAVKLELPSKFSKNLNKENGTPVNKYFIAGSLDAIVAYRQGLQSHEFFDSENKSISKTEYLILKSKGEPCSNKINKGVTYGIRDYKTASRKCKSLSKYLTQLVTYAVAYNSMLTDKTKSVSFVEVILITETKKDGVCLTTLREKISEYHTRKLMSFLETIVTTHSLAKRYPKLDKYLFRDGVKYSDVDIF